ncbi:hypothetical protein [Desulfolutivibrio sulfoxidireducens]|uniref:hypothetical protein n=1 Tax=Desulfolutivibrio sulfoxidireducens TaxID=2773299 RepID=UPI00159DE4A9|nr:hypothetical protein [Desulfolutivibrio sulfoxidireducens]QLA15312.1 hypothetical protein GD605_03730 [Desulfolutivibrio sulfoxidireducens]
MKRMFFLAVLCLAALSACGPARPLSDSEVYSFCLMDDSFSEFNECDSEQDICNAYREVVLEEYPDLGSCLAACNETSNRLWRVQYVGNCLGTVNRGQDWCIQFCRRKYRGA